MGVNPKAGEIERVPILMRAPTGRRCWYVCFTPLIAGIKPSLFIPIPFGTCDNEATVVVLADIEEVLGIRDEPGGQGT